MSSAGTNPEPQPNAAPDVHDNDDLYIIDGMRVLCTMWVMALGVCNSSVSACAANQWVMFYYFTTWKLYIVYSSNLGLDEFFFLSSFLATLKIHSFI